MGDTGRGLSDLPHTVNYTTYANTTTSVHAPFFVYAPIYLHEAKVPVDPRSDTEGDGDEDEDELDEHSSGELLPGDQIIERTVGHLRGKSRGAKLRKLLRRLKETLRRLSRRD
jgi:hypothetical protein